MRPYCLQLQSPAGVFAHSNTTAIWPRGHSGRRATATYAATRTVGMTRIYRHHTTWTASSKLLHVQKPEPAHDDLGGQRAIWRRLRREGHPGKGPMGPHGLWNGATIRRAWRIPRRVLPPAGNANSAATRICKMSDPTSSTMRPPATACRTSPVADSRLSRGTPFPTTRRAERLAPPAPG